MRLLRLARAAFRAELLLLAIRSRRTGVQVAVGALALFFATGAIACLHLAAMMALIGPLGVVQASLLVAVVDIAIAGVLAMVCLNSRPGRAEREARALRAQIWAGLDSDLAAVSLVMAVLGMFGQKK